MPYRLFAAVLGLALAAGAAGSPAPIRPVQRLEAPPPGTPSAKLDSDHFAIRYNPEVLSREAAEEARDLVEKAWETCRARFGRAPQGRIELDLTPRFRGATGFARPAGPRGAQPAIGVRYAELDYLGLSGEYVLTHEVAHVFSGDLAGTALGEGIADWGAGTYSGLPQSQWWGRALRQAGLWIDPEAFFITGEFESTPEVNSLIRTAQYVESALLVRYLIDRFGWSRFRAFAEAYDEARGRLESNNDRRSRAGRGRRPAPLPQREAVVALFTRHLGESWPDLLADWERRMREDPARPEDMRRLVLGQSIYGTIRSYEMWAIDQRPPPPASTDGVVREAFIRANRLARSGDLTGAEAAFAKARAMVEQLRRPRVVADGRGSGRMRAATFGAPAES